MTKAKLKARLQHPVAIAAQGFVFGAILFWATAPSESNAQVAPQDSTAVVATY